MTRDAFAAENVVPLIKKAKLNDTITTTLDAVSAKLTTEDLIEWNVATDIDHEEPADVATASA